MATGFMSMDSGGRLLHCIVVLSLSASAAWATEVSLVGLFPGKAVLVIDGAAPKTLSVGASLNGVRLIAVESDAAVIETDGQQRRLGIGRYVGAEPAGGGKASVVLSPDARGHYLAEGSINGAPVRFVVDTGATVIALGAADARRAGIAANAGEPGVALTANGTMRVRKVKLDSVRVGSIELRNVDGAVHDTEMPLVLLGMSFLNRMEMKREGEAMTLRQRF